MKLSEYILICTISLILALILGLSISPIIDSGLNNIITSNNEEYFKLTSKPINDLDIIDDPYTNIPGAKTYAVAGCRDRRKKLNLYPNIVACDLPNTLTAENYYSVNFNYPYIPGQSEERWLGANYDVLSFNAPADKTYRVIMKNDKNIKKSPPFAANYWFEK